MKSMWIGGIILIVVLMAGTYIVAGDAFNFGEDYINDLTMLAGFAIITITVFVALKYIQQMKNDKAGGELAEESWDGIGEYKNPIPTGWGLAFIGTIVWLMWYWTVGYPINGFSQIGQYNEEVIEFNSKYESKFSDPSTETLTAMGESLFLVQCAPCHGVAAEGINGKAQNLLNRMSKESILHSIKHGSAAIGDNPAGNLGYSMGVMPAQEGLFNANTGAPITDAEAETVAAYVANGMTGDGAEIFAGACASCHGADGKGMNGMSPNLVEYDDKIVMSVLKHGKEGKIGGMPSFDTMLNETQKRALANYIRSIGGN